MYIVRVRIIEAETKDSLVMTLTTEKNLSHLFGFTPWTFCAKVAASL